MGPTVKLPELRNNHPVFLTLIIFIIFLPLASNAEIITYNDAWGDQGFSLIHSDMNGVEINFSIIEFNLGEVEVEGVFYQTLNLPGVFLPNQAGAPDLPNTSRFIALPQGASVRVEITASRVENLSGINLIPAFVIPKETDDGPLVIKADPAIYQNDAYYPAKVVDFAVPTQIRGVDVMQLGITPFQYNPVTRELLIYRDIQVKIDFLGGVNHFGEDRLRSRYWEPILKNALLNYESLPEIDFNRPPPQTDDEDLEYLIIIPDDSVFAAWADTLKNWRNQQGIITGVVPLSEIGGNNEYYIEAFINDAYNTWVIPPVAVLLLSDYQSSGDTYGITSPIYNSYCVSDNIYADINNDMLPDLSLARICARNASELESMIGKMLEYERNPTIDPYFYENPLFAGGWQTDRWFILCTEIIRGYFEQIHGLDPPREYAICEGVPGNIWSSNPNTYQVVNYFGPGGLGYIPQTPSYLTDWSGNAAGINSAINNGAFFLLHRDHGYEQGWGEPSYSISSLNGLNNQDPAFVFSINCLTGKYNLSSNCFVEVFHRMSQGALGLIGASEVSYSFVNDVYIWGVFDSMWPDFDPYNGADLTGSEILRPCFANTYGKYYLYLNSWVEYFSKPVTYNLFHHHGDAFLTLYSEVPQELTVNHQPILFSGADEFLVTATPGAIVALTVDNVIIGVIEADGAPQTMPIEPQLPGNTLVVTATLQNYFRYIEEMDIVPDQDTYVLFYDIELDDSGGNNDGLLDLGEEADLTLSVKNVGAVDAQNVTVNIESADEYITILDDEEFYGAVPAGSIITIDNGFTIEAANDLPDNHQIDFTLNATDGDCTWVSSFEIIGHAPYITYQSCQVRDFNGNRNGILDPGETVDLRVEVKNNGSSDASNIDITLATEEWLITIPNNYLNLPSIISGNTETLEFTAVSAHASTPQGWGVDFSLDISAESGYTNWQEFNLTVGDELYQPSGPDGYGYYAYDIYDGILAPEYDWWEIAPLAGGSGQPLTISTNQTVGVDLPFDFQFYGETFDHISVCSNGWLCFGEATTFIPVNLNIPHFLEPNNLIAPFWDALSMDGMSQICTEYNSAEHFFAVEWYNVAHSASPNDRETFEVIFFDPAHYPTETGDGEIVMNYHSLSEMTDWCTVGIEDSQGQIGLQYVYNDNYIWRGNQLQSEFAIKFSTEFYVDPHAPEPFSLISPSAGDTSWTVETEFTWESTTDPDPGQDPVYEVWIDTLSNMSTKWRLAQNLTNTVFIYAGLPDDETIYWNVRAADINSGGTWAMPFSFETFYPQPPSDFALLQPGNGSELGFYQTVFKWQISEDPDPGDETDYSLWFVNGSDSVGYFTTADSFAVHPDTVSVISLGDEITWYVAAHSAIPDTTVECLQRFTFLQTLSAVPQPESNLPGDFCLFPNYPNPFNPATTIRFGLPQTAKIRITVYDILGRQTALLLDDILPAGYHQVHWNASHLASGIYFVRMETATFRHTMKMLLLH